MIGRRLFRRVTAWAAVMAVVVAACGGPSGVGRVAGEGGVETAGGSTVAAPQGSSGDVVELLTRPADPLDVTLVTDGEPVTVTVGPDGGTVEVTSAAGLTHRLEIPEGALPAETEITLTPLGGAEELGTGAGIQLEPHGLLFLRAATLTLDLPDGTDPVDLVGVSTLAEGEQAARYPFVPTDDGDLETRIGGFSTYGAYPSFPDETRPVTSIGRRVVAEVARIWQTALLAASRKDPPPTLDEIIDTLPIDRMRELHDQWVELGLVPLAEKAENDDIALLELFYEVEQLFALQAFYQLLAIVSEREVDFPEEAMMIVTGPIPAAIDRALDRCKNEHRIGEYVWVTNLIGYGQVFGLPLGYEDYQEWLQECGRFRLVFESTITSRDRFGPFEADFTGFVVGEIEDLYPLETTITDYIGIGPLEYQVAKGSGAIQIVDDVCTGTYEGGVDSEILAHIADLPARPQKYGPWSVPHLVGPVPPPPDPPVDQTTIVLIDPGDPKERHVMRGGSDVCDQLAGTTESTVWKAEFRLSHVFDIVDDRSLYYQLFQEAYEGFLETGEATNQDRTFGELYELALDDFRGGRIYATGTWEGCSRDTKDSRSCERTFITLYHEP